MEIRFNLIRILKWLDLKKKRGFASGVCSEICDVERDRFIYNKELVLALWRQMFLNSREEREIVNSKANIIDKSKKHKTYVSKTCWRQSCPHSWYSSYLWTEIKVLCLKFWLNFVAVICVVVKEL